MEHPSIKSIAMEDYTKLDKINTNIKIKLKLPKQEQDLPLRKLVVAPKQEEEVDDDDDLEEGEIRDEEEEEEEQETEAMEVVADVASTHGEGVVVKLRICPHCNKVFSNGKALGGHMRVHTENHHQSSKPKQSKKRPIAGDLAGRYDRNPSSSPDMDQESFRCKLCPKEFPSQKSLFGHMRSHPERDYRGMQPPPDHTHVADQLVVVIPDEPTSVAEKRLRSLDGWRRTGKRGREACSFSPGETTSSSALSFDTHSKAAASDLMLMVGGRQSHKEENDEQSKLKVSKKYWSSALNRAYDEDELYYLQNLGLLDNDGSTSQIKNDNSVIGKDDFDPIKVELIKAEPIRVFSPPSTLKSKGKSNVGVVAEEGKWSCATCGKTFPTHQALGGHRSSHNKEKNQASARVGTADGSGLTDIGTGSDSGGGGSGDDGAAEEVVIRASDEPSTSMAAVVQHRCKVCNKTFSSGQALGGHKRCHYVVPLPDVLSSPSQSSCQTGRRGNMELDLNVAPDEEDGDGAVDQQVAPSVMSPNFSSSNNS